jgi:hypothetical protein
MLARNEKKIFFVWFLVRQTNYKLIKKNNRNTIEIDITSKKRARDGLKYMFRTLIKARKWGEEE